MKISFLRDGEGVVAHVERVIHKVNGLRIYQTKDDDIPEYQVLEKLKEGE